jgi:hypothetical protein
MKIIDPVLTPDVSSWCDHINAREFEDASCGSVVVGLYASLDSSGARVLSPVSRQQGLEVASHSQMVLQVYYWDDITQDPVKQADWLFNIVRSSGLPIKWIWVDQEQWWTDWTLWQQAIGHLIPMSDVPHASPANISAHFETFNRRLHSLTSQAGVYTNRGFVSTWAAGMDAWLPLYRSWVPHYGRQPKEATVMSWAQLKELWLPQYDIQLSVGQKPELVAGHQFTGDACILPGSYSKANAPLPLDVSMFSKAFLDLIRSNDLVAVPFPPSNPSPTPTPTPTPTPAPATTDYIVVYARVNVRATPSSDGAWVRYAVRDEILKVVKVENSWAQLLDNNYIFSGYITPVPAMPAPEPTPTPTPTPAPGAVDYVVLYARINVRAQPSSSSAWVRFAVKDEILHVVKIENGWAQLTDGTYVSADYIGLVPSGTPAPAPTPTPTPTPASVEYVVLYARINVRAKPDSSSAWVRFAVKDEVLHVVSVDSSWAKLTDGNYVFADYIRKV